MHGERGRVHPSLGVIRADARLSTTMMMIPKSVLIYSLVWYTSCWCATDSQDITTLSAIDDDTDSEESGAAFTLSDNITTESPLPVTTMNEYFVSGSSSSSSSSSSSTVSRDRMGPVSSHNVNHKDKPKLDEVSSLAISYLLFFGNS